MKIESLTTGPLTPVLLEIAPPSDPWLPVKTVSPALAPAIAAPRAPTWHGTVSTGAAIAACEHPSTTPLTMPPAVSFTSALVRARDMQIPRHVRRPCPPMADPECSTDQAPADAHRTSAVESSAVRVRPDTSRARCESGAVRVRRRGSPSRPALVSHGCVIWVGPSWVGGVSQGGLSESFPQGCRNVSVIKESCPICPVFVGAFSFDGEFSAKSGRKPPKTLRETKTLRQKSDIWEWVS